MFAPSFSSPSTFFGWFVLRRARWSVLSAMAGTVALLGNATWSAGSPPPLMPQDLHIEVPSDSLFGSLPTNRGLTVSIYIPEQPHRPDEPFVAILESPASAHTVPLEIDQDRHRHSATVDLGRLSTTMGTPSKATPIQIQIARQRGPHLESLVRRTVVVTVATPGYADHQAITADPSIHGPDRSDRTRDTSADLAWRDGRVDEEDLLGDRRLGRQEGYWKCFNGSSIGECRMKQPPTTTEAFNEHPALDFAFMRTAKPN